MRVVLCFATLLTATGAAAGEAPPPAPSVPETRSIAVPLTGQRLSDAESAATCRDRIHVVRAERGLPDLRREPAQPVDSELLIKAVDHRVDGCSVMVMHHDTTDVRPVPVAPGNPQLRRIQ